MKASFVYGIRASGLLHDHVTKSLAGADLSVGCMKAVSEQLSVTRHCDPDHTPR
jgi:hypothetical protein